VQYFQIGVSVRIGLHLNRFDWPGSPGNIGVRLTEIARMAEAAGFASFSLMDHFFQMGGEFGPPEGPVLEGYSLLNYLAAVTERIQLGMLVTGASYRPPGLLVKMVSTLDVISGGRAFFGIGAGWYRREALGLGLPFPPLQERFERLEEILHIARQMWSGNTEPYKGKHFQLAEPINSPQPLQRPHPPILIGGDGEQKTLRLVARYGDACNLFADIGLEEIRRKLDVLQKHCDAIGRDYHDIERTAVCKVTLGGNGTGVAELLKLCTAYAASGIQQLIVYLHNVHELTPLAVFGEDIIPAVVAL
jgi:F420-dependent oxidoreductase-like protein